VFLYQHFLSDDEANHLISLARAELKRSAVADNMSGKSTLSEVRTSSGTFLRKGQDPIVEGIEDKIAAWTFLPKENGEDIQVLRYKHGEKYEPHYDYFTDNVNTVRGGHRYATVLLYLTDVPEGGETVFPLAEPDDAKDATLSECAQKGIAGIYLLKYSYAIGYADGGAFRISLYFAWLYESVVYNVNTSVVYSANTRVRIHITKKNTWMDHGINWVGFSFLHKTQKNIMFFFIIYKSSIDPF
ncbi:hypothetical protein ACJX0J_029536, partial [Zea mays]